MWMEPQSQAKSNEVSNVKWSNNFLRSKFTHKYCVFLASTHLSVVRLNALASFGCTTHYHVVNSIVTDGI